MAAPSGIVWGSVAGGYGRIGIYVKLTNTATKTTRHTEIWFWSKYTVSDSSNTFYYDDNATSATTSKGSVSIKTTVNSGSGWSTTNQVKIDSYDSEFTRGTSKVTRNVAAKLTGIEAVEETMTATTSYTIPALASYTVTYNDNGGTLGSVKTQTKTYGTALKLTGTATRTGYNFKGWATSPGGSVAYKVGDSYTANDDVILYAVWEKITFTITYKANGGTGEPVNQTKTYGVDMYLSTVPPKNTGYNFVSWNTKADGTGTRYNSGAKYTANDSVTLYAEWEKITFTITYNDNGGTLGNVKTQTKTHGTALKLTGTATRTGYNFKGWATSPGGSVAYKVGDSYTANANVTLYAVWENSYVEPSIYLFSASRCDSSGALNDTGSYAHIKFSWKTTNAVSNIDIVWASTSGGSGSAAIAASGTSGTVDEIIGGSLSSEASYTIIARVADSGGEQESKLTLNGSKFVIDAKAGGDGVSFGKPAERGAAESLGGKGVADFAFDAKFNEPVYGNVRGLNRLPEILSGDDFNNYLQTGCWAVYKDAYAQNIANMPVNCAGVFEVSAATGEGIRAEQWSYLRQKFIPYRINHPTYERDVTRGEKNVWNYGEWIASTLSSTVSEKIYSKSAITIASTANMTCENNYRDGTNAWYTTIPFTTAVLKTGSRLSISGNSVLIGDNISCVKASLQALIRTGTTVFNRYLKIQKSSNGKVTAYGWLAVYCEASRNIACNINPIIIPVAKGDVIYATYCTKDGTDVFTSGSTENGYQSYLTVEEL